MSARLSIPDTKWIQRFLLTIGLDPGPVDGVEGKRTQAALEKFHAQSEGIKSRYGALDYVSETKLSWVAPVVQTMARRIVVLGNDNSIDVRLTSGMRTYAEQDALYAQGRTRPGQIVTNARGGSSMHNFARAVDVAIYVNGRVTWTASKYDRLGALVKTALPAVEWGGAWVSFRDRPHYQITGRRFTAEVRSMFLAGKRID